MTQNRYYSNDGYAVTLANPGGLNNIQTNLQVSASTNWPVNFPFVVSVDPGLVSEELLLLTSGVGTTLDPYVMQRGFDGSTAQPHATNAVVVPKICQLDLAEPQQHINLSGSGSGAHGLPPSAWLGGQYQLIGAPQVLATSQSTVTFGSSYFSAIPNGCHNIVVYANVKTSYTSAGVEDLMVQINGYTGANYGSAYVQLVGTTGSPGSPSGQPTGGGFGQTQGICGLCWTSATGFGPEGIGRNIITFPFYNDTVWTKGYSFQSSCSDGIANSVMATGGGTCSQVNAAVSSLVLFPQFAPTSQFLANSLFALYAY